MLKMKRKPCHQIIYCEPRKAKRGRGGRGSHRVKLSECNVDNLTSDMASSHCGGLRVFWVSYEIWNSNYTLTETGRPRPNSVSPFFVVYLPMDGQIFPQKFATLSSASISAKFWFCTTSVFGAQPVSKQKGKQKSKQIHKQKKKRENINLKP